MWKNFEGLNVVPICQREMWKPSGALKSLPRAFSFSFSSPCSSFSHSGQHRTSESVINHIHPLFTTFVICPPVFTVQSSFFFPPLNRLALTHLEGFHLSPAVVLLFSLVFLFLWTLFVNVQRRRIREQIMKHRSAFHTLFRKNSPTAQRGERSHFPPRFYPHFQSIWLFLCSSHLF